MSFTFRNAETEDFPRIATIAQDSDLLLDDLTESNFPRMLRWLYVDSPGAARVQFVAEADGLKFAANYTTGSIDALAHLQCRS